MKEQGGSASKPSYLNGGSKKLRSVFKDAIREAGLKHKVRVNEPGCFDQCEHALVVVYPDAVWCGLVETSDVKETVAEHLVSGRLVERLRLAESRLNTKRCRHRKSKHEKQS